MAALSEQRTLKFCPFCGGKIGHFEHAIKFCPHCGENIAVIDEEEPPKVDKELVTAVSSNWQDEKNVTGEMKKEIEKPILPLSDSAVERPNGNGVEEERQEFFAKLKGRLNASSMQASIAANIVRPQYAYYHIVLKECGDKETLARRLEKVLSRSYPAIRLAVEKAPCIVVYKGKVDEMHNVIEAFQAERAAISVIVGDIETGMSLEDIFLGFDEYPEEARHCMQAAPPNLWLGDKIFYVLADVYLERMGQAAAGILVITDQAVYYVYKKGKNAYGWLVVPYYQMRNIAVGSGLYYDGLAISYQNEKEDDLFVAVDEQKLNEAYEVAERAFQNSNAPEKN